MPGIQPDVAQNAPFHTIQKAPAISLEASLSKEKLLV